MEWGTHMKVSRLDVAVDAILIEEMSNILTCISEDALRRSCPGLGASTIFAS